MKKLFISAVAAMMGVMMFAAVAFAALSADQAKEVVLKKYPDAKITKVKDKDSEYSITFTTAEHPDSYCKLYIDKETGEILNEKVKPLE